MLETEIKNLTAAVRRLTEVMDKSQLSLQLETPEPSPVTELNVKEPEPAKWPSANVDGLQSRCLELTRIDRANSPKIKAIIASYGAAILKDVPADKLGELASKLEELA